jgi:putative endonuclease
LYILGDWLRWRRHRNLGRRGEDLAHRYLRRAGYTVTARNWRPPQGGGEIDLVAVQGDLLVFVEVKTRASDSVSAPEREIDNEKMWALRRAARDYARRAKRADQPARFDVIAIAGDKLQHFEDAFPLSV